MLTKVIENRKAETVQPLIREHVAAESALYSDTILGYYGLSADFRHQVVDHAIEYVDGKSTRTA